MVVKLNGGLGTSMGMAGPSTIEVKDGLTFLDILARQVMASNLRTNRQVPLLVMNSFTTQEETPQGPASLPRVDRGHPRGFPATQGTQAAGGAA